jgi:nucleoside-diphosphate-sugar epimerase
VGLRALISLLVIINIINTIFRLLQIQTQLSIKHHTSTMSSPSKPIILFLGGAGAQNSAVVEVFSATGAYTINVLTRSIHSAHASELASLPNVNLIEGDCFDEATLTSVFKNVSFCYVNTNGFAIGEKNEIFWGIRIYEIARWAGVKHFIYSSLPYVSKNGDFDPSRRVPFVDGKGKVARKFNGC